MLKSSRIWLHRFRILKAHYHEPNRLQTGHPNPWPLRKSDLERIQNFRRTSENICSTISGARGAPGGWCDGRRSRVGPFDAPGVVLADWCRAAHWCQQHRAQAAKVDHLGRRRRQPHILRLCRRERRGQLALGAPRYRRAVEQRHHLHRGHLGKRPSGQVRISRNIPESRYRFRRFRDNPGQGITFDISG